MTDAGPQTAGGKVLWHFTMSLRTRRPPWIDHHIAPILLGDGIRLYDNCGSEPIRLYLVGEGDPTSARRRSFRASAACSPRARR